jgi:Ca2+-binding EF-hand superfamily protein
VFHTKRPFPTTEDALREVFDLVDADKSGKINLDEIRIMLKGMNPSVSEEEIRGVLGALDIDVNFEEFKLIFGIDGSEGNGEPGA